MASLSEAGALLPDAERFASDLERGSIRHAVGGQPSGHALRRHSGLRLALAFLGFAAGVALGVLAVGSKGAAAGSRPKTAFEPTAVAMDVMIKHPQNTSKYQAADADQEFDSKPDDEASHSKQKNHGQPVNDAVVAKKEQDPSTPKVTTVTATTTTTSSTRSTTTSTSGTTTSTTASTSTTTTGTTTSRTTSSTSGTTTYTTTHPSGPSPTLFCWSHMQPDSYEVALIKRQFERRANIFACNEYAVISSKYVHIGSTNASSVMTWVIDATAVTMGQYGVNGQKTDSFLNTPTFLLAWDAFMNSGKMWPYDFVVKVDPDAVFFPDRLRKHMKPHVGENIYVPNCGKWASGPKLYGSIGVFSTQAIQNYGRRVVDCKKLPWQGWGEDYYMQHCMDLIGVKMASDFQQVGDERCVAAPCSDWTKVAYHDFKNLDDWMACFNEAIGA